MKQEKVRENWMGNQDWTIKKHPQRTLSEDTQKPTLYRKLNTWATWDQKYVFTDDELGR